VPKGEFGPSGQACGTIIRESKRTKTCRADWLAKLGDDRRAAKADVVPIVSAALIPKFGDVPEDRSAP
jgi:hypothetical protein